MNELPYVFLLINLVLLLKNIYYYFWKKNCDMVDLLYIMSGTYVIFYYFWPNLEGQ